MSSILPILQSAKKAALVINKLGNQQRVALTQSIAQVIEQNIATILSANAIDLARMDPKAPNYDRLLLTEIRLKGMIASTHQISQLADPVGQSLSSINHPNGLKITKSTVPLGVVGAIFEARPNVTIDISALCLRSGNGAVLKGGSDAASTNIAIVSLIQSVLVQLGLPAEAITLLPNERANLAEFLNATAFIDVIVPRGSQSLIDFVRKNATVPTIETGAGVCHTYVETTANLTQAASIVVNAKTQRPSVCNSLDTVLVDQAIAAEFLPKIISEFNAFEVGVFADEIAYNLLQAQGYKHLHHAHPQDFGREYLSQNCSIKIVKNLQEALAHIEAYSSKHSEAIITEDAEKAELFLNEVDAAAVYHNASTRFTDGAEFGLGAELGISTQKLHARGPFALEKLVCEKWTVRGSGQVR